MARAKKSVNLKAFSVIYDSENVALHVKYRGVIIDTIKYGDHDEADISNEFTFEHYVKKHGLLIYDAIQKELLPKSAIDKAQRLEDHYISKCPGDVWNTPLFWESSACFVHVPSSITRKALHDAYKQWDEAMRTTTDNHIL